MNITLIITFRKLSGSPHLLFTQKTRFYKRNVSRRKNIIRLVYFTIVTIKVAIEIIVPTVLNVKDNAGGIVHEERAFEAFGDT